MELRQLRYFVAVAEELNISRAAKRIFLTQSALSRQIKALEEELGQCLLEREAHSIRLTPAGVVLVAEARMLLEQAEGLVERVRGAGRGPRLAVGYAPSLAAGLLSAAVECLAQTHPNVRVELLDRSSAEMLAGLEDGSLDVALTVGEAKARRGLQWTRLLQVPLQLAVPAGHALAAKKFVPVADLAGEPLLAFSRTDYPEYWEAVLGWLGQQGLRPLVAGEYDGIDSLMAAVESRLGVALVAVRPGRHLPERVRLKPLKPAPPPVCIAAGRKAGASPNPPLEVFLAELLRAAR